MPALSGLLQDERLSHMARYVLEKIPGEAATQALRKALAEAKSDTIKIGCIHSLARRGDAKSIDVFIQYAKSDQPELAGVAILALSRLDNDKAADAVAAAYASATDKTRSAAADALLTVAARQLRRASRTRPGRSMRGSMVTRSPPPSGSPPCRDSSQSRGDKAAAVLFKALTDKDAEDAGSRRVRPAPVQVHLAREPLAGSCPSSRPPVQA